jgi:serine/threonine protein kinase
VLSLAFVSNKKYLVIDFLAGKFGLFREARRGEIDRFRYVFKMLSNDSIYSRLLTGFSNQFSPGKKLLTSCGSLAYSAPEILLGDPYDAPAIGMWTSFVNFLLLNRGFRYLESGSDSFYARDRPSTIPRGQRF